MPFTNNPILDAFSQNFEELEDGSLSYRPRGANLGLPITSDEYEALMNEFERMNTRNNVIMWVGVIGTCGFGVYKLISTGSFSYFFTGFAFIAFAFIHRSVFSFSRLLSPFEKRRRDIEQSLKQNRGLTE